MTTVHVRASFKVSVEAPASSVIMRTYGTGDPHMIEYLRLSTALDGGGKGNYDHFDLMLYAPLTGYTEWGARNHPQSFTAADIAYLRSIQPRDFDMDQKMRWLVGDSVGVGRPYWHDGTEILRDSTVYGHSRIRVEAENGVPKIWKIKTTFPTGITGTFEFCKVVGFKRSMMGQPVEKLLKDAYLQICTEAQITPSDPNHISTTNRGVKYDFVPDVSDFPIRPRGEYYIWRGGLYEETP